MESAKVYKFVLHVIEHRRWRNAHLNELVHHALKGEIRWDLIEKTDKSIIKIAQQMHIVIPE